MSDSLTIRDQGRVETLKVIVREETPFLPKVAFVLITLASLGGAIFTGTGMGLGPVALVLRWLTLWSLALAGGFLAWRVLYMRTVEAEADQASVDALNATSLRRADLVSRWVAPIVVLGAPGAFAVPFLAGQPVLRIGLVAGSIVVAALLALGVSRAAQATAALVLIALLLVGWAFVDAGAGWPVMLRLLHLSSFTLWLGGALWNIGVAMPAGRQHPNIDAVLAGAHQLDRFRWVVRFALPTIIATGLLMAWGYWGVPTSWWFTFPGVLIPLKIAAIVALVVVFITCPLFRHCSPVQGVCNIDDLEESKK